MFWNKNKKEKSIGVLGEEMAGKYLKKKGYKIVEFNYQNKTGKRLGEIDIVTKKDGKIIFIEVKSRISDGISPVFPEENITRDKLFKIQKIISVYINENNLWNCDYRLDAITVLFSLDGKEVLQINHIESIFY
jgi:putative endonuclease